MNHEILGTRKTPRLSLNEYGRSYVVQPNPKTTSMTGNYFTAVVEDEKRAESVLQEVVSL
jgi:hypothetical protein